jgi:methyl-accepting chemotaxis protein
LINDSVNKVETGVSLVNQSTKNQQEIVESINRVGNIIAEISLASREQSEGIEQINTAVTSMDDSTQQNAALAEQTSAAAVSLDDQMGEMSKLMEFFKVSNSSSASSANVKSSVSRPAVNTIANAPASKMTDIKSYSKPLNISKTVADAPQATSFDDDEWEEF